MDNGIQYLLILQSTVTKKIHYYMVSDCSDSKMYHHFPDVDLSDLTTGEYRYMLYEAPADDDIVVVMQNDPRRTTIKDNKYILVADNKILTADDVVLVYTGEEYDTPLCCVATGLMKVGKYDSDSKQWDKPMSYKSYEKE